MSREDSRPAESVDELAMRVLLGSPEPGDAEQLGRALAESPETRQRFLDHAIVQSVLIEEAKAGSFAEDRTALFEVMDGGAETMRPHNPLRWVSAAAAVLVAGLLVFLALKLPGRAEAAMESLDQVIAAFGRPEDRSYVIRVRNDGQRRHGGPETRKRAPGPGRYPPIAHLDGARLHLRGDRQFVLDQALANGERRVMGGDGDMSWSFRGNGPVRISEDPRRFRGGLPGGRQDLAFLDLRSQLDELKALYRLEVLESPTGSDDQRGLRGRRHSRQQGGPKEVEIWFAGDTGTIQRMVLGGLPTDRGGPRRLELILESSGSLGPDFFNHEAHHEPGRPIEPEPSRRR